MEMIHLRRSTDVFEIPEGPDEPAISAVAHELLDQWFPKGDPADLDAWVSIAIADATAAVERLKKEGLL